MLQSFTRVLRSGRCDRSARSARSACHALATSHTKRNTMHHIFNKTHELDFFLLHRHLVLDSLRCVTYTKNKRFSLLMHAVFHNACPRIIINVLYVDRTAFSIPFRKLVASVQPGIER